MASGDSLFLFDPLSNRPPATNYASVDLRNGFLVLDFDDSTNETAQFLAALPSHYGGAQLLAIVTWTTTTATTNNAKLRIEVTHLGGGANLDSLPTVDGSDEITVTAPSTSGQLVLSQTSSFSAGAAVAGDLLLVGLTRLATDVSDTLVNDIEVVSIEIREV